MAAVVETGGRNCMRSSKEEVAPLQAQPGPSEPPIGALPQRRQHALWAMAAYGAVGFVLCLMIAGAWKANRPDLDEQHQGAPETSLAFNLGNTKVAGYTCGEVRVMPCSHVGGQCKPGEYFGQKCVCDPAFAKRSPYCDWGPIPSSFTAGSNEQLARLLLAYDASNAVYQTDGTDWIIADGSWASKTWDHFFVNDMNGDKKAAWWQACAGLQQSYSKFDLYKSTARESATFVAVGKLNPSSSPSGRAELVVAFGGTFSASTAIGQFEQVLTDIDIPTFDLSWNNTKYGYVHRGFWEAVEPVLEPLTQLVEYETKDDPTMTVTVTGHSLGAALGVLFAAVLVAEKPSLDIHLNTFGTPRSGSPTFAKVLTETKIDQLRIVNQLDLITQVPTSAGLGEGLLHVGEPPVSWHAVTVAVAGPQLTVGFDNVSSECTNWFIGSQWSALVELPVTLWSGCPEEAVMDHLGYQANLLPWLESQGLKNVSLSCKAKSYTF